MPLDLQPGETTEIFNREYYGKKMNPLIQKIKDNFSCFSNDEDIKKFLKIMGFIEANCSQYLKEVRKTGMFLYRGVTPAQHNNAPYFIGNPRIDRWPKDTKQTIQIKVDEMLQKMGFTALRRNSIFATSDMLATISFGKMYAIFPLNGFTYTWSSRRDDWIVKDKDIYGVIDSAVDAVVFMILEFEAKNGRLWQFNKEANEQFVELLKLVERNPFAEGRKKVSIVAEKLLAALNQDSNPLVHNILHDDTKTKLTNAINMTLDDDKLANYFVTSNRLINSKWLDTAIASHHEILINGKYVAVDMSGSNIRELLNWYFIKQPSLNMDMGKNFYALSFTYDTTVEKEKGLKYLHYLANMITKYGYNTPGTSNHITPREAWKMLTAYNTYNNFLQKVFFDNEEDLKKVANAIKKSGGRLRDQ